MTGYEFFVQMGALCEAGCWAELERLLAGDHQLVPGELEAYQKLREHQRELGHHVQLQVDDSGVHVVKEY